MTRPKKTFSLLTLLAFGPYDRVCRGTLERWCRKGGMNDAETGIHIANLILEEKLIVAAHTGLKKDTPLYQKTGI